MNHLNQPSNLGDMICSFLRYGNYPKNQPIGPHNKKVFDLPNDSKGTDCILRFFLGKKHDQLTVLLG